MSDGTYSRPPRPGSLQLRLNRVCKILGMEQEQVATILGLSGAAQWFTLFEKDLPGLAALERLCQRKAKGDYFTRPTLALTNRELAVARTLLSKATRDRAQGAESALRKERNKQANTGTPSQTPEDGLRRQVTPEPTQDTRSSGIVDCGPTAGSDTKECCDD